MSRYRAAMFRAYSPYSTQRNIRRVAPHGLPRIAPHGLPRIAPNTVSSPSPLNERYNHLNFHDVPL